MERYVGGALVHNELYTSYRGASKVEILESPEDISCKLKEWINRTSIAAKAALIEISNDALQMTIQNNVKVDVIKDIMGIMDKDPKADGAVVVTFNTVLGPNLELIESYKLIKCVNTSIHKEAVTFTNLHTSSIKDAIEKMINNKVSYKNMKVGKQVIKVLMSDKPITKEQCKDLSKDGLSVLFEYADDLDKVFLNNWPIMPTKYKILRSMIIMNDDLEKLYTDGADYAFLMSTRYTFTTPRSRKGI
jgi:hypothetical protein